MKKSKGFTLLEVLIGTAVLGMISFIIYSISSTVLESENRVTKRDEVYQMARLALRRVTEDLNMAYLVVNKDFLSKSTDGAPAETAFIGDDKGQYDTLDFNTLSNWRMFRNTKESDQSEVSYKVEPDPEEEDLYRLMRRQTGIIDNDVTEGGKAYPVALGLKEFQLSYYDGRADDWTDNWNSKEVDQKDKLPKAVKITIAFPDPVEPEENINFATITFIGLWEYPIEF